MSLAKINARHNNHYKLIAQINEDILTELQSYEFNLDKSEISAAIESRMQAFYETHNYLKKILDKQQNQAASDYFVESCLIFLKSYFEKIGFKVFSEKPIWKEGKRSIRPDVTIWKDDKLIAAIEMKVQFGRKRHQWKHELKNREIEIKSKIDCKYFSTICFTEANWAGFDRDETWEVKYFSITDKNWKLIDYGFEKMMKQVLLASELP